MSDRKLWEQQIDEPAAAYARFVAYRGLGPRRTLDEAFRAYQKANPDPRVTKGKKRPPENEKPKEASGQWRRDSTTYRWTNRAASYDAWVLQQVGEEAVTNFMKSLKALSGRVMESLVNGDVKLESFDDALKAISLLSALIPAETVAALCADPVDDRTSAPEYESAGLDGVGG